MTEQERRDDWYSKKELFEMIQELKVELAETTRLIREYNGLRRRLDGCEQTIAGMSGQSKGSKDMWGYVVGGIGLIFAIISYAVR